MRGLPLVLGLLCAAGLAVATWAAPRHHVPLPGPDATPRRVVVAYIDAVNARDFDTANAIDARPGSHLGRYSLPMQTHLVRMGRTTGDATSARVLFTADFSGGDGTVEDGPWGYELQRGADGRWHITDAGVS